MLPVAAAGLNAAAFFHGMVESGYQDNRFRQAPAGGFPVNPLKSLVLIDWRTQLLSDQAFAHTASVAEGVNFARDLVGAPSNCKTPVVIAEQARRMANEHGMTCVVLGLAECERLGMGGTTHVCVVDVAPTLHVWGFDTHRASCEQSMYFFSSLLLLCLLLKFPQVTWECNKDPSFHRNSFI